MRALFEPLLTAALQVPDLPDVVREAALRALPLMGTDAARKSFAILTEFMRKDQSLATAARAVTQLPRQVWDSAFAGQNGGSGAHLG